MTSERIVETHAPPDYVVDPFSVSRNSNDRPRFDLKLGSVNKHINKDRIRFDDWKVYKLESFKNNKNRREMSEDKEYEVEIRRMKIKMSEVDNMEEAS